MKQISMTSAVLAALMGLAGTAIAQTTDLPAQPDPATGGKASTKTPAGVGNPTQRPDGSAPVSRSAVRAEARAQNHNNANSLVPKGEASTTLNNQPNATPQPTGAMSRMEVSQEGRKTTPRFGERGERPGVPTNPMSKTGTPQ
jgi:hypothetical protein